MSNLYQLEQRIQGRLAQAEESRQQCQQRVERKQQELQQRFERFGQLADRLIAEMLCPRIATVAKQFANAEPLPPLQANRYRCLCRFHHTDRFPATTTLELSVSHDAQVEHLLVDYDLEILPVFFQFQRHDEITFPLDGVDEERLKIWVEDKLLLFVDTYLKLEMADAYQRENLVTDPVCGNRITKQCAVLEAAHEGQQVYFCSRQCHDQFTAHPQRFLQAGKA